MHALQERPAGCAADGTGVAPADGTGVKLFFYFTGAMLDVRPARNALACEAGGCSMFILLD